MFKKLCTFALILALLCSVWAYAGAVSDTPAALRKLSDKDIELLYEYVQQEMISRGLLDEDEPAAETSAASGLWSFLNGGSGFSDTYVWITDTGTRYHKEQNCGSTTCTRRVTLEEAQEAGYKPCSRCNPDE